MGLESDIRDIIITKGHHGMVEIRELIQKAFKEQLDKRPTTVVKNVTYSVCEKCNKEEEVKYNTNQEHVRREYEAFMKLHNIEGYDKLKAIKAILQESGKIAAIKRIKDELNISLKEAKDNYLDIYWGLKDVIKNLSPLVKERVEMKFGIVLVNNKILLHDLKADGNFDGDNKLRAVKYIKEITNLGLKDSKELYEKLFDLHGPKEQV